MSALANKTRFDCVALLIEAGPKGMLAGAIAARFKTPKNTMSAHFNVLKDVGLIANQREGRLVYYRANVEAVAEVMAALKGLLPQFA